MENVSIIVPSYNQGIYLGDCLQSILDQTYVNWDCIIVNDGSNDQTEQIAKDWCKNDSRFSYYSQVNLGVSVARNKGISLSEGVYILTLDADDRIHPDYLKLAIEAFNKNKELTLVYGKAKFFGEKSGTWELPVYSLKRLGQSNIIYNAAVYKKADWKILGGYDVSMLKGLEDWDFWIRLLQNDKKVYYIPEVCFYYRIRSASRNHSINPQEYLDIYKYLNIKHIDFFIKCFGTHITLIKENNKLKKSDKAILNSKKHALRVLMNFINPFAKNKTR